MKIDELTKEQASQLETYRDKWICIGLDTSPCNREEAEKWAKKAYTVAKEDEKELEEPKKIHWANSPMEAVEMMSKKYGLTKQECFNAFSYGNHDASWLSFHNFFKEVVGLTEETEQIIPLINVAQNCGWIMLLDTVACLCERPEEINLIAGEKTYCIKNQKPEQPIINGVLHKDGGPAIKYRDGFCKYYLNGVAVTKEIAETPWDKLDPKLLFKTENAEVRREIVRKIGMERILETVGYDVLDTQNDYQLLKFDIGDGRKRPYLKMTNPSLGVYHVEGVPPDTKTVKEALYFRNGTDEKPIVLT